MPIHWRTHHHNVSILHFLVHLVKLVAVQSLAIYVDAVVGEVKRLILFAFKQHLGEGSSVAFAVGTSVDEENLFLFVCLIVHTLVVCLA